MKKISIGILGYNEEYGIAHLFDSLQHQTLLHGSRDLELEIVVISNGSQDKTAAVARTKLAILDSDISSGVIELPVADKCAAWNHFIHHAAQPADCYIFLDADIVLVYPDRLEELVNILADYPECRICGGKVINQRGELVSYQIDGKCYAIRGEIARNLYIPAGVVSDDAYIASTVITNWYETSPMVGEARGYVKQANNITVRSGGTPRDRTGSYWIACRKRTIVAEYTQRHIDYCMRSIFGGGELAKTISMQLFTTNPNWFTAYLSQVSRKSFIPHFNPPQVRLPFLLKEVAQFWVYCYCYLLSVVGIKNQKFGHLAWKLKSRYW